MHKRTSSQFIEKQEGTSCLLKTTQTKQIPQTVRTQLLKTMTTCLRMTISSYHRIYSEEMHSSFTHVSNNIHNHPSGVILMMILHFLGGTESAGHAYCWPVVPKCETASPGCGAVTAIYIATEEPLHCCLQASTKELQTLASTNLSLTCSHVYRPVFC